MPQLIRTPEQIFREEGKDIYLIRFRNRKGLNSPVGKEIQKWLHTNLPQVRIELLAPSEDSGCISGYFGDLRVDFSEADLTTFCARWETPEGKSVDRRFQCYLMPYQTWFEKHGHFVPTNERPTGLGLTLWWDTPIGIIHHQVSMEEAVTRNLRSHPGKPADLWMHAIRLWPELASVDATVQTYGWVEPTEPDEGGNVRWILLIDNFPGYPKDRKEVLREWFGLPEETLIRSFWG